LRDTQGENPALNFSKAALGKRAEVFPEDVRKARHIHARLLVGRNHPLVTDDVFALLNVAADQAGWAIDYGRVDLAPYWP